MKDILKKKWKYLLAICIGLAILVGIYAYKCYYFYDVPAIAPVSDTSTANIAGAQLETGHFINLDDAKEVPNLVTKRIQAPPDVVYYTNTQQEADSKARQIAQNDGADYVIKKTQTIIPSYNAGSRDYNSQSSGGITNNYYAITQEKKNKVAAGVTLVDKQAYTTIAYQHDRVEVETHTKDFKSISGATVLYTINKW